MSKKRMSSALDSAREVYTSRKKARTALTLPDTSHPKIFGSSNPVTVASIPLLSKDDTVILASPIPPVIQLVPVYPVNPSEVLLENNTVLANLLYQKSPC